VVPLPDDRWRFNLRAGEGHREAVQKALGNHKHVQKHPLTVGKLRDLIAGLPDKAEVVNDIVDSHQCREYTAGIVSAENQTPKNWRGKDPAKPELWFHVRISPMEGDEEEVAGGFTRSDILDMALERGYDPDDNDLDDLVRHIAKAHNPSPGLPLHIDRVYDLITGWAIESNLPRKDDEGGN
jgi:hypothetical protein